jgi:signal transduction histidine kinase/ActR/RegA family two-component response regulator
MPTNDGSGGNAHHERVLVLAPVGRDAALLCELLALNEIDAWACNDMPELVAKLGELSGAIALTEEALTRANAAALAAALHAQPQWSDVPLLVLIDRSPRMPDASEALNLLLSAGNVVVLERPLLGISLITAVRAALRTRRRQYDQRDLMQSERAARHEAQTALHIRDEFLATVSHELRTPLSAIVLWTKLMQGEQRDSRVLVQGLPAIARSADALSKLIEDLLDMSRMIAGTLRINLRSLLLDETLRASIEVVRPLADVKAIDLRASFAEGVEVLADPHRLQQAVWNLLTNAIKFTPRGGRVSIRSFKHGSLARIEVADTGKGIEPQFLPHVFEHFRQAESTTERLEGGLGLGLAITRQLMQLHGGTIRASSAGAGHGAVFTMELPTRLDRFSEDRRGALRAIQSNALAGVRVLFVEDDRNTRDAIAATLETYGARVFAADTAQRALEILAAGTESGQGPHVLLTDLGLPTMDGWGLLRQIRSTEQLRNTPPLPAALMTGYVSSQDRDRALAMGFRAYLPKPIEPMRLVTVLEELARGES